MNNITFENYPDIRDLTRKMSQDIQSRLGGHLEMVKTHFRPAAVFGPHLASSSKAAGAENPRNAGAAFAQLKALFQPIALSSPFNLEPELGDAIDISFATPILCPFLYAKEIATSSGAKRMTITAPFRFVLTFPEYSFTDLRAAVRGPKDKLRQFALHYLVLNYVVMQNKKLLALFDDLRFPIRTETFEETGSLPVTTIAAPAGSLLPPDNFVAQVSKFSGADVAEELVDMDAWNNLPDPLANWFREASAKIA